MTLPGITIIGERINSSRKSIASAIENKDEELIQREARMQHEAGATYIDVNAGTFLGREVECLPWLVRTVQAVVDGPLCIDSPDPAALETALAEHRGKPVINSISLERERMEAVLPLVVEHSCGVIGLLVDSIQVPVEADKKIEIAVRLIGALSEAGVRNEDIYIDPIIQPAGMTEGAGLETLRAFAGIRERFPDVHVLCGLRNISFRMPCRARLDNAFLAMALAAGVDTAIIDPCDDDIMRTIFASEALLGRDEFCIRYIEAFREGRLGGDPV